MKKIEAKNVKFEASEALWHNIVTINTNEGLLGGGVPMSPVATSHVGILQDSYVSCRNFVSEALCREIWPCSIKTKLHV